MSYDYIYHLVMCVQYQDQAQPIKHRGIEIDTSLYGKQNMWWVWQSYSCQTNVWIMHV